MANKPIGVAFVGAGDTSVANVKGLLDDWLREKDTDGEDLIYTPPIVPDQVKRAYRGLMRCWDWLAAEFQEVQQVAPDAIIAELKALRDDVSEPADVFLVFIPGDDDPFLDVVREAIKAGIPVRDITAGLVDFNLDEEEPPASEPRAAPRARGRARTTINPDSLTHEIAAETPAPSTPELAGTAESLTAGSPTAAGVSIVLSQRTIAHLLATFASLADDVGDAMHARATPELTEPATPAAAQEQQLVACWKNEKGEHRRAGRGRGKSGETRVSLTEEEAAKLGI